MVKNIQLTTKQLSIAFVLSTFFLCLPAFYNNFPLIFPDSSAYIYAGFTNNNLGPRVWTYGGFVRHISLAETLWLVVLMQGFLTSVSIYLLFKYVFKTKNPWHFFFYIVLISLTTAASFHVSRIMPDMFTPLIILHLGLLLFVPSMSKLDRLLSGLLFFVGISMHNSHTILVVLMFLALGAGAIFPNIRRLYKKSALNKKGLAQVGAMVVGAYFFVCTLHWSVGGGFRATQGGSIFLFARLIDYNIAQDYLDEHCEEMEAHICTHKHTLDASEGFLWGDKASSLSQHGYWNEENKVFYQTLVRDILTTPKYLFRYIVRSVETTAAQLFYVDYNPEHWNQWMFNAATDYYPHYKLSIQQGRQSRQDYRAADIGWMNHWQHLFFLFSILIVFWSLLYAPLSTQERAIILLILLGLVVNAFITAATSGVYDRYQSRVAWLLTLPAFWLVCNYWEKLQQANSKK